MSKWRVYKSERTTISYEWYVFIRAAYHKAMKHAEESYNEKKAQELIRDGIEKGLNNFFPQMKNNSGPSVNQDIFVPYLEKLFAKD